ncbi:MAG: demethoxyubiquinone hydroxylase family protein [Rickettsiaceae bacterium]|nr:demethoxyubiquinone hydroxylase family protein [Rickettsiaceae bacterium]
MPRPYFSNKNKETQEIIMVNHAGEYGAQRIYEGQIAYTKDIESKKLIQHMLHQELEHLEYFDSLIKSGQARPTALIPIWKIFGYSLGAISARLGPKTAMLVTESVEKVIVDHYQEQINYLKKIDNNSDLLRKIKKFKQDEADHIHIAIENSSNEAHFYAILSKLVEGFCRSAIFISKKI